MQKLRLLLLACFFMGTISKVTAQEQDLLKTAGEDKPTRELVKNAFKSSRVINGHSIEFIGAGVLDVRILHRFGLVSNGFANLFGLDEAAMRMGFDYGITNNLTVGIGRSTLNKELDGFVKVRLLQQTTGAKVVPFSIVLVGGTTLNTTSWVNPSRKNLFSSRMGYYTQAIVGRKFSNAFSLQVSPVWVHRNLVDSIKNNNDTWAIGIGSRIKLSRRIAFVADYHIIASGKQTGTVNPLSLGFDIETGGHVFQLHFSNARGMNERAFITETTNKWGKGEIRFGFNLSRVFTVRKKRI